MNRRNFIKATGGATAVMAAASHLPDERPVYLIDPSMNRSRTSVPDGDLLPSFRRFHTMGTAGEDIRFGEVVKIAEDKLLYRCKDSDSFFFGVAGSSASRGEPMEVSFLG